MLAYAPFLLHKWMCSNTIQMWVCIRKPKFMTKLVRGSMNSEKRAIYVLRIKIHFLRNRMNRCLCNAYNVEVFPFYLCYIVNRIAVRVCLCVYRYPFFVCMSHVLLNLLLLCFSSVATAKASLPSFTILLYSMYHIVQCVAVPKNGVSFGIVLMYPIPFILHNSRND